MLNIYDIIKKMPEGRELFSMLTGVGTFHLEKGDTDYPIEIHRDAENTTYDMFGRLWHSCRDGVCVVFPTEDSRDWKDWAQKLVQDGDIVKLKGGQFVRFDPSKMTYSGVTRFASEDELTDYTQDKQPTEKAIFAPKAIFEPFDKVIVCDGVDDNWSCSLFSNYDIVNKKYTHVTLNGCYVYCLPFEGNENLVGTKVTEEQVAEINKVYK